MITSNERNAKATQARSLTTAFQPHHKGPELVIAQACRTLNIPTPKMDAVLAQREALDAAFMALTTIPVAPVLADLKTKDVTAAVARYAEETARFESFKSLKGQLNVQVDAKVLCQSIHDDRPSIYPALEKVANDSRKLMQKSESMGATDPEAALLSDEHRRSFLAYREADKRHQAATSALDAYLGRNPAATLTKSSDLGVLSTIGVASDDD